VVTYHIRVVFNRTIKPYRGVYSRAVTYCAVRNRNSDLGCFILEAMRLLVYLAQTWVVPRNVLKKATWSWLTPVNLFGIIFKYENNNSCTRNIPPQVRHLSIVENVSLDRVLFPNSRGVRSILFPIWWSGLKSVIVLDTWVSRYKYLRYLDLSDSSFETTMPNSITKLEHLCFLDLSRNDKVRRLPKSICKLVHLQVLLLGGCTELENLPKGLGKLISLCHFIVTTKQSVLPQDEFVRLINLQTLSFDCCYNIKFLLTQKLPSVEELNFDSCDNLESLPLHIFPKLKTLFIRDCNKLNLLLNNEIPIETLRMKHLDLVGFPTLVTLPDWMCMCHGHFRDFGNHW